MHMGNDPRQYSLPITLHIVHKNLKASNGQFVNELELTVQELFPSRNPVYAAKVKEEIDKLLKAGFIYPVQQTEWLSPVVIVPKKNGKLRVCEGTEAEREDQYYLQSS